MGGQWESILVALVLITIFYFLKKYFQSRRPPLISNMPQSKPQAKGPSKSSSKSKRELKLQTNTLKSTSKSLKRTQKAGNRKTSSQESSQTSNQIASLVLHPHSLERARKEFAENAQRFRGSYESLFLACHEKVTGVFCEQVIRSWEDEIRATEAPNLILVWTTIVQKHCGRNLYRTNSLRWKQRDANIENDILQDWLKQLFKWGIQRELQGESTSSQSDGESGQNLVNPRWIFNGEILEQGEEPRKLLGH